MGMRAVKKRQLYNTKRSLHMDPNETKGNVIDSEQSMQTCPHCGMEQKDWTANHGQGYPDNEELYCCQGCAEGTGCTCAEESGTALKPKSKKKAEGSGSAKRRH
jgi:hypothetical protein